MTRRFWAKLRVTGVVAAAAVVFALAGCSGQGYDTEGPYAIAGGGTTGVYYSYGEQLAAALHKELGITTHVTETNGSVDNLLAVADGRALLGFAQGDTAADAIAGTGAFDTELPIRALARVYDEYVHIVVPENSPIRSLADLAGHRVSLGAENSGVQVIASRVLEAAQVPLESVVNPQLSLDAAIDATRRGNLDGFFWVGGLPTPGIQQLAATMPIRLLPIDDATVAAANHGQAGGVYRTAEFPLGMYGITATTVTMTVPNYLITRADASPELIHDVTRVLFHARSTIARTVPAAEVLDRRQAIFTGPIELHEGAAEYYISTRH